MWMEGANSFFLFAPFLLDVCMPSGRYFDFVTLAKGFAIICVVLGHFTPSYMPSVYQHLKDGVYLFHMPLFMLLAGFLFQNSVERRQKTLRIIPFIKKKFLRLMVPYFFLSLCIAILNLILQQFIRVKQQVTCAYFIKMCYENIGGSATFLWFLYTLFLIFIIAIVFVRIPKGQYLLLFLACIFHFLPLPSALYMDAVGTYLIYFVTGTYVYKSFRETDFVSYKKILLFICSFILSYIVLQNISSPFLRSLVTCLCGLSACMVILYVSYVCIKWNNLFIRALRIVGNYSSYIYLLHMMGVYPVRMMYEKIGWYSYFSYALALLLAIVIGCVLPVLIDRYIISSSQILSFLIGDSKKSNKNLVSIKK